MMGSGPRSSLQLGALPPTLNTSKQCASFQTATLQSTFRKPQKFAYKQASCLSPTNNNIQQLQKSYLSHTKQQLKFTAVTRQNNLAFSWGKSCTTQAKKPKTGIILMNMGGPEKTQDVQSFLTNLFSDRELMRLPLQTISAPLIAKRRTPSIQDQYSQIGGGSPIKMWTEKQGAGMEKLLEEMIPEYGPFKSYIAFRYVPPFTADALKQIKEDGIERLIAFTQYPQYSCSTTGSSLAELYRQFPKILGNDSSIKLSAIDRWATHPTLIKAFAKRIKDGLDQYPEADREDVIILFSAHSLPMKAVNRGDPYPAEVAATVYAVMQELGFSNTYRLVWQSKVGPLPWLGPQTSEALEGYAKQGKKNILTVPIAFTSDHIETLFELDIEYGHQAKELGITGFKRAESLNDEPLFIQAMAEVVSSHLKGENKIHKQLTLRCPMCKGGDCKDSKEWLLEKAQTFHQ